MFLKYCEFSLVSNEGRLSFLPLVETLFVSLESRWGERAVPGSVCKPNFSAVHSTSDALMQVASENFECQNNCKGAAMGLKIKRNHHSNVSTLL